MAKIPSMKHSTSIALSILLLVLAAGCSRGKNDGQVAGDVQSKINADPIIQSKTITVGVSGGVATLSGTVGSDLEKTAAGNDATQTNGVNSVDNQITVQPASGAMEPAAEPRAEAPARARHNSSRSYRAPSTASITIPHGTLLTVRLVDDLDSSRNKPGDAFRGNLDAPIMVGDRVVVPRASDVQGQVVSAKGGAHFAGRSDLSLALTRLTIGAKSYQISTDQYTQQGAARGKRTAEMIGGGAGVGALIGGLTGGGKGALIGSAIGAGAGTGVQAVTHGQQVKLPSETVLQFHLAAPLTVQPVSAQRSGSRGRIG
jgi:hypothetical protein